MTQRPTAEQLEFSLDWKPQQKAALYRLHGTVLGLGHYSHIKVCVLYNPLSLNWFLSFLWTLAPLPGCPPPCTHLFAQLLEFTQRCWLVYLSCAAPVHTQGCPAWSKRPWQGTINIKHWLTIVPIFLSNNLERIRENCFMIMLEY